MMVLLEILFALLLLAAMGLATMALIYLRLAEFLVVKLRVREKR